MTSRLSIAAIALLSVALTGISLSICQGEEADSIFRSANQDFDQQKFEQASLKYLSLVEKGRVSPDLYYNLGTSLYRQGKPGEAMLWFRRAQLLDTNLPEVKQNTEFLRTRIAFLEFADSGFDQFLRMLPSGFGIWTGSIFLWLALLGISIALGIPQVRESRSWWISAAVICLMLAFVAHRLGSYRNTRIAPENFATVIAGDASAMTAPTPGAKAVIKLPPGSEVRILQNNGPWRYVDIPGNLRGWVRATTVEPNWPVPKAAAAPSSS